ncbi:MAG: hypothetical protein WCR45_04185 [Bacteroidaceae bacterium]|nr:hypothetical protein [Bacteroidaceae bacterium]
MKQPTNYIATWFYKESKADASYYPQVGKRGDSTLVHSIYMQIQVPFYATFRHYNPEAKLLFFTNINQLPVFLEQLFKKLGVEIIQLPYRCIPPEGWHNAWRNQFYLYDILKNMEERMEDNDRFLICDADCLCHSSLNSLFEKTGQHGCALYKLYDNSRTIVNGITLQQMADLYEDCYQEKPAQPINYYGGEFMAFRGDIVKQINTAYHPLWNYNLKLFEKKLPKLNEEALFLSVLITKLNLQNSIANTYIKRMWTWSRCHNVEKGDEEFAVWHLPYEKKRGLYDLYRLLRKSPFIKDEKAFWKKASCYTGIPEVNLQKQIRDHFRIFVFIFMTMLKIHKK